MTVYCINTSCLLVFLFLSFSFLSSSSLPCIFPFLLLRESCSSRHFLSPAYCGMDPNVSYKKSKTQCWVFLRIRIHHQQSSTETSHLQHLHPALGFPTGSSHPTAERQNTYPLRHSLHCDVPRWQKQEPGAQELTWMRGKAGGLWRSRKMDQQLVLR